MDIEKRTEAYHKSRLGQILVTRGYITRQQLDDVVSVQDKNNALLGELLLEKKMISRWQLRRALSNQTRLRLAASLAVALLGPITSSSADEELADLLKPLGSEKQSNVSSSELTYDLHKARAEFKGDGFIRLRLPSSVGELHFDHLRIEGLDMKYESLGRKDINLSDAVFAIHAVHNEQAGE